jgi:hypothetical protein
MMPVTTAFAPGSSMSPITTLDLMIVLTVGHHYMKLRHLPILCKGQSHLLANTIRTSYVVSRFLTHTLNKNATTRTS